MLLIRCHHCHSPINQATPKRLEFIKKIHISVYYCENLYVPPIASILFMQLNILLMISHIFFLTENKQQNFLDIMTPGSAIGGVHGASEHHNYRVCLGVVVCTVIGMY